MSVNQHTMGHFHSWVYSGSSFFKYSELILPIYMDGRAETKTTVSHPLVQLHSNITAPPPLFTTAACHHSSAKIYYYPSYLLQSCS